MPGKSYPFPPPALSGSGFVGWRFPPLSLLGTPTDDLRIYKTERIASGGMSPLRIVRWAPASAVS